VITFNTLQEGSLLYAHYGVSCLAHLDTKWLNWAILISLRPPPVRPLVTQSIIRQ